MADGELTMAATKYKCVYCGDGMSPMDGEWVSHRTDTAQCSHAPDGKHARQIVIYTNNNQKKERASS